MIVSMTPTHLLRASKRWNQYGTLLNRVHYSCSQVLKQGHTHSVAFPGFALALSSVPERNASGDLLEAIGITGGHPSHLEVVQAVDIDTLPLFWRSPVHCTLYLPFLLPVAM